MSETVGLDMYLYERGDFPWEKLEDDDYDYDYDDMQALQVGYWRKSNMIHAWFVDNVQNGKDECQYSGVTREQLEKLLADVTAVLGDHQLASRVLPTRSGFFFGSTDYDDWYFDDLKETVKILHKALEEPVDGWIYNSSW